MSPKKVALYAAILVLLAGAFFWLVYRPWSLSWGATEEEVDRPMVGDDLVQDPTFNATRAVTVDASPEEIWPWIVQMGYKKAGFYSYDKLDNDGIPSAERIIPEYQDLEIGDLIPLTRQSSVRVAAIQPHQHMLWVFRSEATWAWGLYETDRESTRLVTRLRVRHGSLVERILYDAFEIFMMRKCLLGIKRRAESMAGAQLRP